LSGAELLACPGRHRVPDRPWYKFIFTFYVSPDTSQNALSSSISHVLSHYPRTEQFAQTTVCFICYFNTKNFNTK